MALPPLHEDQLAGQPTVAITDIDPLTVPLRFGHAKERAERVTDHLGGDHVLSRRLYRRFLELGDGVPRPIEEPVEEQPLRSLPSAQGRPRPVEVQIRRELLLLIEAACQRANVSVEVGLQRLFDSEADRLGD